jgi:hypothetical protein
MSPFNLNKIEDQITMLFSGVINAAMNIVQAEEAAAAAASSST